MSILFKNIVYRTIPYELISPIKQLVDYYVWEVRGRPIPIPSILKQKLIIEYARQFSMETLIETGTFLGDMVYATKIVFSRIISIELDKNLYKMAKRRFYKYPHITILWGDSSDVLHRLLPEIKNPCLFWLDAHYSGGITARAELDTPIIQELGIILKHNVRGHIVLIDDSRRFIGQNSYPTIDKLRTFVTGNWVSCTFEVKEDIIRIHDKYI